MKVSKLKIRKYKKGRLEMKGFLMQRLTGISRTYWLVLVTVVITTIVCSYVTHAANNDTSTVYAAVSNSNGNVRIISDPNSLKPNEHLVQWNVQGPPGSQGIPGTSSWTDGSGQVTTNSKVGIGTSNPVKQLDVTGDIQANRYFDRDDTNYVVDPASTSNMNNVDVTGSLSTDKLTYLQPRTHYYSVPACAFFPTQQLPNVISTSNPYVNYGIGAYLNFHNQQGYMNAAINLPDGATLTDFKVHFYVDTQANYYTPYRFITVSLQTMDFYGGFQTIGQQIDSFTISGFGYKNEAINHIIDNSDRAYYICVDSLWTGSVIQIMGATITYSLNEAP
jgi:hypothetical protein